MLRMITIALCILSLVACQSKSPIANKDGAPQHPPLAEIARLPDAVPKAEPYSKYGNPDSYKALGKTYKVWDSHLGYAQEGIASWYGTHFHGKRTSSGEPYDMFAMTAAHKNLPIPSYVRVTNLDNHKSIVVRVNDRGPFKDDRIIDLSYAAATKLGILDMGTGRVKVEAINAKTTDQSPAETIYIQVAAFAQPENANALVSELKYHTDKPIEVQPARSLYHVRVGPFASTDEAHQFKSLLSQLNFKQAFVTR